MHTSILLLRGINVGGKNKLPMKQLVALLEKLQLANIQTYIQSGNVVFQTKRKPPTSLNSKIAAAIEDSHGFSPSSLVLSEATLMAAIAENPFSKAVQDPKTLHLFFLASPAKKADLESINKKLTATEKWELTKNVFYLYTPDGFGRSKLAASAEKHLGVPTTARNWRTVEKLRGMVAGLS